MALGGDANLANGTNRIAILLQNVAAVSAFQKGRKVPWRIVLPLLPPVLLGAAAGAWLATVIPSDAMKRVFAVANRITDPSQLGAIEERLGDVPLIGHLPASDALADGIVRADPDGGMTPCEALTATLPLLEGILAGLDKRIPTD